MILILEGEEKKEESWNFSNFDENSTYTDIKSVMSSKYKKLKENYTKTLHNQIAQNWW